VSANAKRFFLRAFGCEGFAAKRRVLCEVERESAWQARLRDGHVPTKPRKVRVRGGEFAAYFMIVHAERSPMIFLVGIPVSVGLYAALFLSYLI